MNKKPMIKIGKVWVGKDRLGNTKLIGDIGIAKILILKNINRDKDDNDCDFFVYVADLSDTDKTQDENLEEYFDEPLTYHKDI